MSPKQPKIHPRALTRGMHFAFWLQIVAIVGSCTVSAYLIYAGYVAYQQLASVGQALPRNGFYLIFDGVLLLGFSLWRLVRAIRSLKSFRIQYDAHVEATRRA